MIGARPRLVCCWHGVNNGLISFWLCSASGLTRQGSCNAAYGIRCRRVGFGRVSSHHHWSYERKTTSRKNIQFNLPWWTLMFTGKLFCFCSRLYIYTVRVLIYLWPCNCMCTDLNTCVFDVFPKRRVSWKIVCPLCFVAQNIFPLSK